MDVAGCLELWGGVGRWSALVKATSWRAVVSAVNAGLIVRDGWGRYALPSVEQGFRTAHGMSAVLSHQSAAAHWGWEQKDTPAEVSVTVARGRRLRRLAKGVAPHWADLEPDEVVDGVTSRRRTLADCLRTLPFDAGLAIADSAIRNRDCTAEELGRLCRAIRGPGADVARRVAAEACGLAANPFESVLRALSLDVGLDVEPQVEVFRDDHPRVRLGCPDLVDRGRRLVLEADSYEFHGGQAAFAKDCRRYNAFQLAGFRVFRLPWVDTLRRQDQVRDVLEQLISPVRVPLMFSVAD
ncbi:hypothetical protein HJ590_02920 [Naumannella sp. ID2617S]|nr:hypothetical protein [Naumannella sp. ID2617S]